jgi:putative inorganic carbon (hco3(-)) transporter
MRTIFIFGVIFAFISAGFFSPFSALLGYLWFALFRPQEYSWVDISSLRISLILSLLVIVPSLIRGKLPHMRHWLSLCMLLFLGVSVISHFTAVNQVQSWEWVGFLLRLIFICLFMITLTNTPGRLTLAIATIAASLGFHTAKSGVRSLISGGVQYFSGVGGFFIDNNGYAMGAVMIIPLLWATGRLLPKNSKFKIWLRWGYFLAVPFSIYMVISTFSRGGFLGLIAIVITFVFLQKKHRIALILSLAIIAVTVQFIPMPKGYLERIQTIKTYDEIGEKSALSRLYFWEVAYKMAKDRPLGVGLKCYDSAFDQYDSSGGKYGQNRSVHSSHFQVLAELGFPGLALWLSTFAIAFITAFRLRRIAKNPSITPEQSNILASVSTAIICSMTGFIVSGSFIALALNDLIWMEFALLASTDIMAKQWLAQKVENQSATNFEMQEASAHTLSN